MSRIIIYTMFGFILFGGVFGAYAAYNTYANCRDSKVLVNLTKNLEDKGVILEEWDGIGVSHRVKYLRRMTELQNTFEGLADKSVVFKKLLQNPVEFYEIVNELAMSDEAEVNGILYRVLYLFVEPPKEKCADLCNCGSAEKLYNLLVKVKD